MARPIATLNKRGVAALEAISVATMLMIFVVSVLGAAYFLFARTWVRYQSEQALLCLAQGHGTWNCRHDLKKRIDGVLPWGRTENIRLNSADGIWNVEVKWKNGIGLTVRRQLRLHDIVRNRALH